MIIQIRGTSGSGKTTVVKQVMNYLGGWDYYYIAGRKKPLYYYHRDVTILGHYESPCGGCDTIGSARAIYNLIQCLPDTRSKIVLCEGLLLSEDVKWSLQLPDLRAVFLTTPLETCLAQIQSRRQSRGNAKPLNPANTTNRVKVIERARTRLAANGVPYRCCTVDQATAHIIRWIGDSYRD